MMFRLTMMQLRRCTKQLGGHQSAPFSLSVAQISEILKLQLGLSDKALSEISAKKLLRLSNLTEFHIQQNCIACQALNLDDSKLSLLPSILAMKPAAVLHKVKLAQEMGNSRPSIQNVKTLYADMHKTLHQFKESQRIAPDLNIAQHVFHMVGRPLEASSQLMELGEHMICSDYYEHMLHYFYTSVLDLPMVTVKTDGTVIRPSFRLLLKMMNVVINKLGLDRAYIKAHPSIIYYSPENVLALWRKFIDLGFDDIPFPEMIRRRFQILDNDPENVGKMLECFKEYGVPSSAIGSCMHIFEVSVRNFRARYEMFMDIPEISLWRKHPRFLYLIYHHKIVMHHLEHLRSANRLNDLNIHTISSSKSYFRRYLKGETTTPATVKHMRFLMEAELDVRKPHLMESLTRHPFWRNVSYLNVSKILRYLKTKYSEEDICHGIHLVLYPLDLVQSRLEETEKKYTRENGFNFKPRHLLALCLYIIEKDNHFRGGGIWQLDLAGHDSQSLAERELRLNIPSTDVSFSDKKCEWQDLH